MAKTLILYYVIFLIKKATISLQKLNGNFMSHICFQLNANALMQAIEHQIACFPHWIESHICTVAHPNYHILPFYNKLKRKNFRYKNQNYIHSGINTRKNYQVIKIILKT